MSIEEVALLGADGKLGPCVLHALVTHGFKVTVLKRASSKSKDEYPDSVKVARVPDDLAIDAVTKVVSGKHAVIVTIKGNQTETQVKLAEACAAAGVQRFIPADFGSTDSSSQWAQQLAPLFKRKTETRERLIQLSKDNSSFTWTSLVCGHFFDWNPEFLHIWIRERKAEILDDGEKKWSASTLARIAEATARILKMPEPTRNRVLYVQSFCVSQNQVIEAFERATGSTWLVDKFDSSRYEQDERAKAENGDLEAVENLVWMVGTLDANWENRDEFAMQMLDLEDESLTEVIGKLVRENQ